jgi:hypothetical protein
VNLLNSHMSGVSFNSNLFITENQNKSKDFFTNIIKSYQNWKDFKKILAFNNKTTVSELLEIVNQFFIKVLEKDLINKLDEDDAELLTKYTIQKQQSSSIIQTSIETNDLNKKLDINSKLSSHIISFATQYEEYMENFKSDEEDIDIELVLYRYPKEKVLSKEEKVVFKNQTLNKLALAKLDISCINILNSGIELVAKDFKKRYDEWAQFLGWKVQKSEFFRPKRPEVSILFKGLGGLDDEHLEIFGKKISSDFIRFQRNPQIDEIKNCNVKLFFSTMPYLLYLNPDRKIKYLGVYFRYYISFNLICEHCCLKGHTEKCCPMKSFNSIDLTNFIFKVNEINSSFLDLSDVELDLNILNEKKLEDIIKLPELRIYAKAKLRRKELVQFNQSKTSKQKNKKKNYFSSSTTQPQILSKIKES